MSKIGRLLVRGLKNRDSWEWHGDTYVIHTPTKTKLKMRASKRISIETRDRYIYLGRFESLRIYCTLFWREATQESRRYKESYEDELKRMKNAMLGVERDR